MFGAPWMLLGLGAAIFIALAHRLFRQPAPIVKLASIRLLPASEQEPVRARRWQDLTLMALRLLLWTALALALAKPSCAVEQDIEIHQGPQAAFIVLQADARSHHIVQQKSLWEHTIARANTLIEALAPGSSIYLTALAPGFERSYTGSSKAQAKAHLRAWQTQGLIRQSQLPRSAIYPLLEKAAAQSSANLSKVGYFVGEAPSQAHPCPASGVAGMGQWICLSATKDAQLPPPATQLGITNLDIVPRQNEHEPTLELVAKIRNYGTRKTLDQALDIEWYIDDELRQTQRVELQDKSATAAWYFGVKDDQPHRVRVQLRHNDSFDLDNRQERWIAQKEPIRVLLVDGDPSEQREHDEVFLLAKALEQAFPSQGVQIRGTDPSQFEALLAASADAPANHDVIVLANVSALSTEQSATLTKWVQQGLGLWITAGSRLNAQDYNQRLDPLLPLRLRSTSAAHQGALTLSAPNAKHPLFSKDIDPASLTGGRTHRIFLLEPDPRRDASVALRFANGAPTLVTKEMQQGRVAWWSTSIDRAWTDVVLHPGFVPLSRAVVSWLAKEQGPQSQSTPAQQYAGLPIELSSTQRIKIQGPKQAQWVSAGAPLIPKRIGLYQGTSANAKHTHRFSVTLDPAASPPPLGAEHAPAAQARARRSGVRSYLPVWSYLWPLAALALVAETLLRMLRLSR